MRCYSKKVNNNTLPSVTSSNYKDCYINWANTDIFESDGCLWYPFKCTANSHNAARWLPAGRCGRLCAMAFLAPAGCNSGESGKIVLRPSPKISLQPYYAGKVSRVEFHLPHAAGRWGSGGSLQKFGPLPSVCLFQDATRLRHFTF